MNPRNINAYMKKVPISVGGIATIISMDVLPSLAPLVFIKIRIIVNKTIGTSKNVIISGYYTLLDRLQAYTLTNNNVIILL